MSGNYCYWVVERPPFHLWFHFYRQLGVKNQQEWVRHEKNTCYPSSRRFLFIFFCCPSQKSESYVNRSSSSKTLIFFFVKIFISHIFFYFAAQCCYKIHFFVNGNWCVCNIWFFLIIIITIIIFMCPSESVGSLVHCSAHWEKLRCCVCVFGLVCKIFTFFLHGFLLFSCLVYKY